MRRDLAGSRMAITGASQGIGHALALAAARRGVRVLAIARQQPLLDELAKTIRDQGGTVETVAGDITVREDRERMVEGARDKFDGLDVLVNNAGIGATGHFADVAAERLRKIMEVNFFGLTETTRVFLPLLKESAEQKRNPAIVNISSIAGKRGIPARSEYSASKFAVQGFSEALRAELAKDGIDVLLVCPGLTQTNFSQNMLEQKAKLKLDHMRGMTSEQVADAALSAIAKGKREVVLTMQGKLMCWVNRFLPRLADKIAAKRVRELFKDEIEARKNSVVE